ncbi:Uncharacterised protein [Mycobacteroides abscessus subsp. massiliense]|nr:Uncharacterised protein [Mycobacteroides abscessus subsp. massiliense]
MVHFGVDGQAAVRKPFHHMHFPQRTVSVQWRAMPPGGDGQQLTHPGRARQRRAAHVVLPVNLVVDDPGEISHHRQRLPRAFAEVR